MGLALQTLVVGLSSGAVFALVGLGFTLVWSLTRTVALAHGDVLIAAVLLGVLAVVGRSPVALAPSAADSAALVVVTCAAGVALSIVVYLAAVRPFLTSAGVPDRRSEVAGWVAGTLLAGLVIRAALGLAFAAQGYAVPDPLHLDGLTNDGVLRLPAGATVPVRAVGVLVAAAVVAVAAERFLSRSRIARGMRAVAADREAAALCGVSVQHATLLAFGLAGLLAAVAGLLAAPDRTVTVNSGIQLGLAGAAAALVGGLGSPRGALAGGVVVGLAQQIAVAVPALGARWSDVVPLLVLVVLVALRPEGLGVAARVALE